MLQEENAGEIKTVQEAEDTLYRVGELVEEICFFAEKHGLSPWENTDVGMLCGKRGILSELELLFDKAWPTAIVKEPGKKPETIRLDNATVSSLQSLIGGDVTFVQYAAPNTMVAYDAQAQEKGLACNFMANGTAIHGTAVICLKGADDNELQSFAENRALSLKIQESFGKEVK